MSYLGCYLGLADDDQRCVLEDDPLPHHLITRVVVSLECLTILLRQGVKGGLDDIVLVEVRSVDIGASFLHD
jgi:hypothetical protein